jgi:MOSC domain-containing protein YiiM
MTRSFRILAVNVSVRKGEQKHPVERALLRENHGIVGDAHAGDWHRQVSLLAEEEIDTMRGRGVELHHGDFAENLTTRGIDLAALPVGSRLHVGSALLEVTQIGKECHHGCAIRRAVGDCVMPRKGIFARVVRGGEISSESECSYDL